MPRYKKGKMPKARFGETKLLVLQFRQLYKKILDDIKFEERPDNFEDLRKESLKITSIQCLKYALLTIPILRHVLISKINDGGILSYLIHQKTRYLNFARILRFLNKIINGFVDPEKFCQGFWKAESAVENFRENHDEKSMQSFGPQNQQSSNSNLQMIETRSISNLNFGFLQFDDDDDIFRKEYEPFANDSGYIDFSKIQENHKAKQKDGLCSTSETLNP